jgi:hypothetical protein
MKVEQGPGGHTIPVVWYFCLPGAQLFPGKNAMVSSIWDNNPLDGPPDVGEQTPTQGYYTGGNLWGYPGICQVGTAFNFQFGFEPGQFPASPPPVPDCCAPAAVAIWWLRPELKAPQKKLPNAWLAPWDITPTQWTPLLLSADQGDNPVVQQWEAEITTGGFGEAVANQQFFTAPLPAQVIPAATWSIGIGTAGVFWYPYRWNPRFSVFLIDGNTLAVKQTLFFSADMGPFRTNTELLNTAYSPFPVADVSVADGDFLCLEIGMRANPIGGPPSNFYWQFGSSGDKQIFENFDSTDSPASFIATFVPPPPPPTPSFVIIGHTIFGNPGGLGGGTTAPIDTTGANLIVVFAVRNGGFFAGFFFDSFGNTWLALPSYPNGVFPEQFGYYCVNPIVGPGHTFSLTGPGSYIAFGVVAASGALAVSPLDQTNGNAASPQPGPVTPTVPGELLICGGITYDNGILNSIDSGFTILDMQPNTGNQYGLSIAYLIQAVAMTVNPSWPNVTPPYTGAQIATFKPA